jgi:branched-chain amino acid transport system ATP-binding protein
MLRFNNVYASYGSVPILNGISFSVPARTITAMLGGNGTGKSTTLKVAAGLVRKSSGEVLFEGSELDKLPTSAIIGQGLCFVAQGKEIFSAMTVEENLLMGAYHRRKDRIGITQDIEAQLTHFPRLKILFRKPAGALSGGERQLLSIARALMSRPKLLMLDEPSAALAPKVVDQIAGVIQSLKERGLTILLVEQNVTMALEIADYAYIVRSGRIAHEQRVTSGPEMFEELQKFYLGANDVASTTS